MKFEREAWAEQEARHFIKTAEALEESGRAWLSKPLHEINSLGALQCAIASQTWRSAADALRRPRLIREEMEQVALYTSPETVASPEREGAS